MGLLSGLSDLGSAVWLTARAGRGFALDLIEQDDLARGRFAGALDVFVWRPVVVIAPLALLVGVIFGVSTANILKLYNAEVLIVPGMARVLAREVVPLVIGVFAAGRVSVELATRIGAMQLARELEALEALGQDPVRYILGPALAAILLAAPLHMLIACACAWLAAGLALQPGAVLTWRRYIELTLGEPFARAALAGLLKTWLFFLIAAAVGAAAGARPARGAAAISANATAAFTAGLIGVFTAAALWTALL